MKEQQNHQHKCVIVVEDKDILPQNRAFPSPWLQVLVGHIVEQV